MFRGQPLGGMLLLFRHYLAKYEADLVLPEKSRYVLPFLVVPVLHAHSGGHGDGGHASPGSIGSDDGGS